MTARRAVQGISAKAYAERRRAALDAVAPQSALLLPAGRELLRNGDTHYPFRHPGCVRKLGPATNSSSTGSHAERQTAGFPVGR